VSESDVHPTVVIEIEDRDCDCAGRHGGRPRFTFNKLAFTRILEDVGTGVGDEKVYSPIIVVISADCPKGAFRSFSLEAYRRRDFRESPVSVIPIHSVSLMGGVPNHWCFAIFIYEQVRMLGYIEIEVSIVIVVNERR
jgi:hypothetical protein